MTVKLTLHDWIAMDAENGTGGGAGDPPAGDSGAPPAGDGGGEPPAGDGAGDPPDNGAAAAYRPEGLPDNLFGASNEETIDRLAKAVQGYRQKDSERGVPENEAAYADFGDSVPDELKDHIGSMSEDTAFQNMAQAALEMGMPVQQFQGLTLKLFGVAQEMGVLEPFVDVKAEQAALVPEDARALPEAEQKVARERRMNDNYAFLDTLTAKGEGQDGMAAEVADYAKAMLGDSAKGHQFIEFMRSKISGGPSPYAGGSQGGSGGADPKEDLRRRAALPENTVGHPDYNRQSAAQLDEDYKKIYGE